jgi:hypothetical protein
MTKYACFDPSSPAPFRVTGWYDTSVFDYPNLPSADWLLEMTDEQWDARLTGVWAVNDGALVAYAPPPPTPTSHDILAEKIAAGIGITCTSNPSLDAVYALDDLSAAQIFQLGLYASQFGVFPGGATQAYPDITGVPHTFTVAQFVAFLRVVAPLISALTTQAAVMSHGGNPAWPSQSATIP